MKTLYLLLLLFICLLKVEAQLTLSSNQMNLCEGNSTTITLNNTDTFYYPSGKLQRNGMDVATSVDGQLTYTTSVAGEYQYVYNDINTINNERGTFRQIIPPKLTTPSFYKDITFISATTGFIAGSAGTLLKTINGGQDWTIVLNDINYDSFNAISFSDVNNGWVLSRTGKVIKTTNGGTTWVNKNFTTTYGTTDIAGVSSSIAWATEYKKNTIKKAIDGGDSWQDISVGISNSSVELNTVFFINQNVGWTAGTYGMVSRTTNGGTTWTATQIQANMAITDIYFIDANNGWLITESGKRYKSTNGGATWSVLFTNNVDETNDGLRRKIRFIDSMNGFFQGVNLQE